MKKEKISLPKYFIAKKEEYEEWVKEEETSEVEGINAKCPMYPVNDAPDSSFSRCDADTLQAIKELKMKSWNVSSTR